jgi:hypothetical protein
MRNPALYLSLIVSALASATAFAHLPVQPLDNKLLLTLPVPVRRAVIDQVGDEKLQSVVRTNTTDEPVVFEIQTAKNGKTRDLTIAADGKILDKQITLEEAPVPVRKSIQINLNGATLEDITKDVDDTFTVTYIVNSIRGGTNHEFIIGDDGDLQEKRVFLSELPASVLTSIRTNLAGATLGEITEVFDEEDYDVSYDVKMTNAGKMRTFLISTNGELLRMQVFLNEVPAPVQKSIQAQSKRGRLGEISKCVEDGVAYYSVDVISNRKTVNVTFDATGAFWGEEENMLWADLPPLVKRALKTYQGTSEISDVNRTTEGTNTTYEIEFREEHKDKRYYEFKSNGTVIP